MHNAQTLLASIITTFSCNHLARAAYWLLEDGVVPLLLLLLLLPLLGDYRFFLSRDDVGYSLRVFRPSTSFGSCYFCLLYTSDAADE